ncbi:MAG TPA: SPFH domain-containing protein [Anaerolineae bacterium]|nr:SPFH domain-containing protein [Anaerolineae bacterium]HMR64851.1 SPFH domain-containing protein [Anaerolineae bacterium]
MALKKIRSAIDVASDALEENDFKIDPRDFFSAQERAGSVGTQIAQLTASLSEAAQILNSSRAQQGQDGRYTNVISPVIMPKETRSYVWVMSALMLAVMGVLGFIFTVALFDSPLLGPFGLPYLLLWLSYVGFSLWKNTFVMIPDGCQALITKYQKVEEIVGPGRKMLLHPLKRVSYIVNTTKEYPYNAPIREAFTQERVEASVDLFLQFRIENPSEFIFALGGAKGFSEKLHNAISEVTRGLIYDQKAEDIYDLVGESTQGLLESLNRQFLPAVRFVNANITHAEPSSQEYRMDLAAAEVVRVAKEAYTYQYELQLRKEQDEGELNKDLASLREQLSEIRAEIATYQAQIDTAKEKAVNRANAYAKQLLIEAESEARANAALLEAQALDIKLLNSAMYPEILEYRFRKETLNKLEAVADKLPQIINVGPSEVNDIDFMATARKMLGVKDKPLYTAADIQEIRQKLDEVRRRIQQRSRQIETLAPATETTSKDLQDRVADLVPDEPELMGGGLSS